MHEDHRLIEGRLLRALGRLRIYSASVPLEIAAWPVEGEPVPVAEGLAGAYRPVREAEWWGRPWGTTWFRVTGAVPEGWAGRTVEALIDLGFDPLRTGFSAEGLVYRTDGSPIKGLNPRTQWVRIAAPARGGERVELYVEAASNPVIIPDGVNFWPTPLGDPVTAGDEPLYRLGPIELAVFEPEVFELVTDLEVLGELAAELPAGDARRSQILAAVGRALDRIDFADVPSCAAAARAELAPALRAPARASAHRVSAVGHAHIDSAWLWPTRETVRKVARTCANVTDLMDAHPELVYAMSSAQQYAWLKQHRPEVFARVAEHVKAGAFLPVGGMWVEADSNLPGGEALARQFAYGKRFFLDEFGVETAEVWLPDSFGYSAALPQLVALSGSRWFLTQKISWNQTNRFPHHTFWWEGIDGTRVFTHFPPVDTYNSQLTGAELAYAARNFAEKASGTGSLVPFGHGDGGGGPTREMLARAARLRDLDGSPCVTIEPPSEFFARTEAEYPDAPVWSGELYLEIHRGTYTSQARTKQGNRRCEHLLREAELWCATAALRVGAAYPYEALERIWKLVLLQQFHDILPGSSIHWVHREAVANYTAAAAELERLVADAQRALAGTGDVQLAFNATPHPWRGIPALGAAPADEPPQPTVVTADGDGFLLDNGMLRVCVDPRGLLTSVYDQPAERELLAPGSVGNLLQLHPDTPNVYDAWDIDAFYRNVATELTDVVSLAAADGGVRIVRRFGASTLTQTVTVAGGARRVDFDTEIDWQESEKLLKVGFDIDVAADRSAAETQFGHVYRPTHANTSWDAAKFEICAHRFLHVGEPGFGVAVVNDSTYGHDVTRRPRAGGGVSTVVRLSLLRAPRCPDPVADRGPHRLRYALLPGTIADAIREGYRINLPARPVRGAAPVEPLVSVEGDGVIVESVKLADDRSGDVVVRVYEALGGHARATLRAGFGVAQAHAVDLLERPLRALDVAAAVVALVLRPFEIVTVRLRPVTGP